MINIIISLLFLLGLVILLWQASNLISIFFGSPYVGADRSVIKKALELANLKKNDIFYELGCGTGEVLLGAEKFGAKVVGYEISPFYFLMAKLRTWHRKNIEVRFQDIRNADLADADVIYCYLLPKFLEKLAPKFKKELKKSARLVSIGFSVPRLKNQKIILVGDRKLFIYS